MILSFQMLASEYILLYQILQFPVIVIPGSSSTHVSILFKS